MYLHSGLVRRLAFSAAGTAGAGGLTPALVLVAVAGMATAGALVIAALRRGYVVELQGPIGFRRMRFVPNAPSGQADPTSPE